jgi:NAD-dependent SIR2 family protein deacetylase
MHAADDIAELVARGRCVVLTGAGCSTESGIPDYRGPKTREKARNPIKFMEFVKTPEARRRYWARSMVGWPRMKRARPNAAHAALAALEERGLVDALLTQNVDRLHHGAGSREVVELHGALADVRCLDCGHVEDRDALQARLLGMNPGFGVASAELAPDGDAVVDPALVASFRVASCERCGGTLKPDVVFFGENVPRHKVTRSFGLVDGAASLLVVGSSLAVYSGFRFVRRARELGLPVAFVNLGAPMRGLEDGDVFVDAPAGATLDQVARALGASI